MMKRETERQVNLEEHLLKWKFKIDNQLIIGLRWGAFAPKFYNFTKIASTYS